MEIKQKDNLVVRHKERETTLKWQQQN